MSRFGSRPYSNLSCLRSISDWCQNLVNLHPQFVPEFCHFPPTTHFFLYFFLWTCVEHIVSRWALSASQWQLRLHSLLSLRLHSIHMWLWMRVCSFTQHVFSNYNTSNWTNPTNSPLTNMASNRSMYIQHLALSCLRIHKHYLCSHQVH